MPVAPANFESHAGRPESQPISTTARNEGGGWVSLSSGGSRIRDTNSQASGAPSSGDADYPVFSSNLNPLMPRPIQTNRRPLDGPPFDLNSVAFPARTQAPGWTICHLSLMKQIVVIGCYRLIFLISF